MAGTDAGSIVAVEVLVEQDVIVPVRILLELPRSAVDRPSAFGKLSSRNSTQWQDVAALAPGL
jgi:hypothetical protein